MTFDDQDGILSVASNVSLSDLAKEMRDKGVSFELVTNPVTGRGRIVNRHETVAPAPRNVASIANFQRKEKPESFLGKFKRFTMPDHDPDGPRAA